MQAGSLNFNFVKKLVKVVTFMCARGPAPHVARGRKHRKRMASLYKHMGKLQRAVTLIVRCKSKICAVKSLVSTHSACPCKNYLPKCSQAPCELFFYIFFYLVYNYNFSRTPASKVEKYWPCPQAPRSFSTHALKKIREPGDEARKISAMPQFAL